MIVLGVAAVTLVAVAVLRKAGVPAAVVLVVAGLIIGFLPFVPDVSLDPNVVLLGLLPLLVFDAAVTSSPTAFLRNARSIGVLAVGFGGGDRLRGGCCGPLARTPVLVDVIRARHGGRSDGRIGGDQHRPQAWPAAAAAHRLGRRGAVQRRHRPGPVRRCSDRRHDRAFLGSAHGGVDRVLDRGRSGNRPDRRARGRWLRNRVDDPPIEIAGSILVAYAAYLPAEALHASGVLAAVFAGLYLGWHSSGGAFSARSRLQSGAFWATLVFLVNAALFMLVGLSFHTFSSRASGRVDRLALTGVGWW